MAIKIVLRSVKTACHRSRYLWQAALFFGLCLACQPQETSLLERADEVVPAWFPRLPIPVQEQFDYKKTALGRKLFFDPILSRHHDLSCSSCHLPQKAFTDGKVKSINVGEKPTLRNSPSLLNVAWHPYLFMDGGNPTLESQLLGPIENPLEMDLPFPEAVQRVADIEEYAQLFEEAFNAGVSPFTLSRALAAYERTLVSVNSPFDQWHYLGEDRAMGPKAKAGYRLFTSQKLKCASCHSGSLFTDFEFRNNGLKENYANDPGRGRITLKEEDVGKFKTASLRNVSLTAPYMHDGSLETLEQVINHYATGGKAHPNKDEKITGFEISELEKEQLLVFLESLTDTSSYKLLQSPEKP